MDQGIEFVPCSGRPFKGISDWFKENPKIYYIVSVNGAVIMMEEIIFG